MRKSHFNEAQIIGIIKVQEAGMATGGSSHMLRTCCRKFTVGCPPSTSVMLQMRADFARLQLTAERSRQAAGRLRQ